MSSAYHLSRKLQKDVLNKMRETRLPQPGYPGGAVFYVDGVDGSDSGPGDSPESPFKTITYALTKCTDRKDDLISVLRMDTGAEADYPIDVNKRKVHIIAQNSTGFFGPADPPAINYDGDSAGFTISAHYVEIAGFDIGGDATHAGIEVGSLAGVWGTCIHDCLFGFRSCDSQDGIKVPATYDAPYLWVYDCIFGNTLDRDGFRCEGNMTRGYVGLPGHGNLFYAITGTAINMTGVPVLGGVFDNRFSLPDNSTQGTAITFGSATATTGGHGIIDGNSANYQDTATGTDRPFVDYGNQHWLLNYCANVAVVPATSV